MLCAIDQDYVPALSTIVDLDVYARKLVDKAVVLLAVIDDRDVGLIAVYMDDSERKIAYISTIGVLKCVRGLGVGEALINSAIELSKCKGMLRIRLEVARHNHSAIKLYEKVGFSLLDSQKVGAYANSLNMEKNLLVQG